RALLFSRRGQVRRRPGRRCDARTRRARTSTVLARPAEDGKRDKNCELPAARSRRKTDNWPPAWGWSSPGALPRSGIWGGVFRVGWVSAAQPTIHSFVGGLRCADPPYLCQAESHERTP